MNLVFERSGYVSSAINLAHEEIPEDTIVLVSAAPKFDFLNDEIIKLENYLSLGGNLILLYDSQLPSTPLLSSFLLEWGVIIEDKLIFDDDFTFLGQSGFIAVHVVEGGLPSTVNAEIITSTEMPLGAILTRPLNSDSGNRFNMSPFISTFSASSYAKDVSSGSIATHERESGDESGPFTVAYNIRRLVRNAQGNQVNANLIVAGMNMFDDHFLRMYGDTFYNGFLLVDLANDFNPFGQRVYIPAKDLSGSVMLISSGSARTILILLVILMPLAIITTGVIVWRKRRHK